MQALRWIIALSITLTSCTAMQEDIERQKSTNRTLIDNQKVLRDRIVGIESRFKSMEHGLDLSLSRLYCLDKNVEAFLSVCNNKNSAYCSKKSFEDVLLHMASQRHAVVYPSASGNQLSPQRIEELKLLLTEHIEYSTKFIVLAHTPSDTPEAIKANEDRADYVIGEVRKILREQPGQTESAIRLIGPWVYPYRVDGRDIDAIYKKYPGDKPIGSERKSPPHREDGIWIFRTDCPVGD